jgi:hypothetical protein
MRVCSRVQHEPFRGNLGVACQSAPARFRLECTKQETCGEVVECLRRHPDHVLLSTDRGLVEHCARKDDGSWVPRDFRACERFELESVGCELYLEGFGALAVSRLLRCGRAILEGTSETPY